MSWTTPPTFVPGDPLAADELNILGDDLLVLKGVGDGVTFSGCRVTKSSQSIANAADVDISFSAQSWDYGSWWSSGTDIVVPAGAIPAGFTSIAVMVIAYVRWAANGTGGRIIRLMQNGSSFSGSSVSGLSGDTMDQSVSDLTTVVAGDILTLQVRQSSGASLVADAARLTVVRYAPAA
jgi:hypothetical protein